MATRDVTVKIPVEVSVTGIDQKLDDITQLIIRGYEMLRNRIGDIETMVYNSAEELRADIDQATNQVADRFDALQAELDSALANVETGEDAQAAVAEVLGKFSDLPEKLRAIGASEEDPVPADVLSDETASDASDLGAESGSVDGGTVESAPEVDVTVDSPTDSGDGDTLSTPDERLNP